MNIFEDGYRNPKIPELLNDSRMDDQTISQAFLWVLLNHLNEFEDTPEAIKDISDRLARLRTHSMLYKFAPLYSAAVDYKEKQNVFPGLDYFNKIFDGGQYIVKQTNEDFSKDMYLKLIRQLDYEIIIQDMGLTFTGPKAKGMDLTAFRYYGKQMLDFADKTEDVPLDTKNDWIDSYDNYIKEYSGIYTGIKALDEAVGKWSNLTTIAAPSSHGKSTLALSIAYNVATFTNDNGYGRNVLYISYEMPKSQMQAKLASIESSFNQNPSLRLKATDIVQQILDEDQKKLYKGYMTDVLHRLNNSGGYLSLMDNTSMNGATTFEEFLQSIEAHSNKVGKIFDLIIIDNVDSLNMYKGERGQEDMVKMNGFITKLDAFSKTYMDGHGTNIVLLSQVNRDGIKKLKVMESSGSDEISIDFTVLSRYSSLYERATTVLVLYSSALMRANNKLSVMPVKLRNKPLPTKPVTLTARWEYSYIGGAYVPPISSDSDVEAMVGVQYSGDPDDDDDVINSIKNQQANNYEQYADGPEMVEINDEVAEGRDDGPPWEEDVSDIKLDN